ncbi:MAG: DUF4876 domain-containing protein [Draconibacterium sp.]|nr:DUF4876 domain-containing protein [Draconibacterium sp.]
MKKIIYILILFIIGCDIYETPTAFNFSVTAKYPPVFNNGGTIKDAEIIVRNNQTGREFKQETNETGMATFDVRGGNYDIIISFSEEHEIDFEGIPVTKTILFSGSLNGEIILKNGNQLEINTNYSVLNEGFVIKELYTSGSRTPEGETYNPDKFVEIYNNSDQVLYSDGLCFGIVRHRRTYTPNPWVDSEGNILPRIPLWSFVAIVPGSGKEHPIQPGKSFVIALSGLNHRDDPNGNPNSIDLSKSEWEMYVEDGKYADTPAVPNILMQRINIGTAMGINVRGQVSIIFRLPTNNFQTIFSDPNNFMKEPDGSLDCFMVPFGWIIDGVENPEFNDNVYKRLPNIIDIGFIQHRGTGERVSIKRKVKEVINGRTVYQDTNNSTVDFLTNQEPTPGVIAKN